MVLPVMRRSSALLVLKLLDDQTTPLYELILVDQENLLADIDFTYYNYDIHRIVPPWGNIGTNQAWNKMWSFNKSYDYIGLIGDDYTFGPDLIEGLVNGFLLDAQAGGTTATIFKNRIIRFKDKAEDVREVPGKGHMGATLFTREMIQAIPRIPKKFFIFYGDNWIGHWINRLNNKFIEVKVGIRHDSSTNLSDTLDYRKVLREEAKTWTAWCKKLIKLNGRVFKEL